jgi:DNA-directed RNA polymerase subunit M/transcription elongation factor TFIIS
MLSKDRVLQYLRTGGNYCPFCGSDKLSSSPLSVPADDSETCAIVECLDCKKQWKDIYKLVTIEEVL